MTSAEATQLIQREAAARVRITCVNAACNGAFFDVEPVHGELVNAACPKCYGVIHMGVEAGARWQEVV